jgi:hypothetical protein
MRYCSSGLRRALEAAEPFVQLCAPRLEGLVAANHDLRGALRRHALGKCRTGVLVPVQKTRLDAACVATRRPAGGPPVRDERCRDLLSAFECGARFFRVASELRVADSDRLAVAAETAFALLTSKPATASAMAS